MEVDASVGPDIGDFGLLLHDGAERSLGGDGRLGPESEGVARSGEVAGFGVVAHVVGYGFGAADACVLLGRSACGRQQSHAER